MAAITPGLGDFRSIQDSLGKTDQVKLGSGDEPLTVSKRTLGGRFVTFLKSALHINDKATLAFKQTLREAAGDGATAARVFKHAGIEKSHTPLDQRKIERALSALDQLTFGKREVQIERQLDEAATRKQIESVYASAARTTSVQTPSGGSVTVSEILSLDANRQTFVFDNQTHKHKSAGEIVEALDDFTGNNAAHTLALSKLIHQGAASLAQDHEKLGLTVLQHPTWNVETTDTGYKIRVHNQDAGLQSVAANYATEMPQWFFADPQQSRHGSELEFEVPFDAIRDDGSIDFDQVEFQRFRYSIDFVPGEKPG